MTRSIKSKIKAVILICSAMFMTTACARYVRYSDDSLQKEKEAAIRYLEENYPGNEFTVSAANDRELENGIWKYDLAVYGVVQDNRVYYIKENGDWNVKEYLWKCYNCNEAFNIGYEYCPYCGSENTWHIYHPMLWGDEETKE